MRIGEIWRRKDKFKKWVLEVYKSELKRHPNDAENLKKWFDNAVEDIKIIKVSEDTIYYQPISNFNKKIILAKSDWSDFKNFLDRYKKKRN